MPRRLRPGPLRSAIKATVVSKMNSAARPAEVDAIAHRRNLLAKHEKTERRDWADMKVNA